MTENMLPVPTAVWFTALKAVFCEWPLQLQTAPMSQSRTSDDLDKTVLCFSEPPVESEWW